MNWYILIYKITLWVDILPIALFLFKLKYINSKYSLLFSYTLVSCFSQWLSYFLASKLENNHFIINFYNAFEFIILFLIYSNFSNSLKFRKLLIIFLVIFFVIYGAEFRINSLMENTLLYSSISYVFWAILVFVHFMNRTSFILSDNIVFYYFNSSILLYFSVSTVLFFLFIYLNEKTIVYIWPIHNFFEIISKLIITYAFWKIPSKSVS